MTDLPVLRQHVADMRRALDKLERALAPATKGETLDVVVIDTEAGREAPAETFSGGERVILSEALALALTTLACREHGIHAPTLIRDESGAALSATRAPQWIAMLRRAADLIGAGHVLFVSHDQAAWELADASIVVADGKVTVQS